MNENRNVIVTTTWSSEVARRLYESNYEGAPEYAKQAEALHQCGGCSFFAAFNQDWGHCAHAKSPHHLETVFEHFGCPSYADEGWGPHSFSEDAEFHCRCHGNPSEYWNNLVKILNGDANRSEPST
jgi:hypothetical protein